MSQLKLVRTFLTRFPLKNPFISFSLLSLASMASFLMYAHAQGVDPGYPLDDAWIHQTYARNLAEWGEFSYVRGQPSAGSTSPLWTLMISAGYAAGLPARGWTLALGWAALSATAWMSWAITRKIAPGRPTLAIVTGAFCTVEWHLIWSALSGMETPLFIALSLTLIHRSLGEHPHLFRWVSAGLCGGLLMLTRPEGVILVILAGLWQWARQGRWWALSRPTIYGMSVGVLLIPYLAFNWFTSGTLWPNTFYAKQAEYRQLIENTPLWIRWIRVIAPTLVGGQALLVPGAIVSFALMARQWVSRLAGRPLTAKMHLGGLLAAFWLSFTMLYALRLPVTYQHGRYLMPTIPIFIILGTAGTAMALDNLHRDRSRRLAHVFIVAAMSLLGLGFLGLGAKGYADDVAVINGEMVTVARWLNEHTPLDALVAAHDIGAIGYFARRPLLDLAGLITPAVIPFIRDEDALLEFIQQQGADYVVTFPSWYPRLTASPALVQIYQTNCAVTRALGQDNMAIYKVLRP